MLLIICCTPMKQTWPRNSRQPDILLWLSFHSFSFLILCFLSVLWFIININYEKETANILNFWIGLFPFFPSPRNDRCYLYLEIGFIHLYTHLYTNRHTHIHTHQYTQHIYINTYTHRCILHTNTFTYTHTHTHIQTHTDTHTQTLFLKQMKFIEL